jgi:ADP-ribose pyrophosphatase YjhB (NUDIX family)
LPLKEDMPRSGRLIAGAFQMYWRFVRGVHLSVEACVVDEAGRTLLVQRENGASWELPRSRVRQGETLELALRRTLRDAAGVEVNGEPQLSFFYVSSTQEQTGVYRVPHGRTHSVVQPRLKTELFSVGALPPGVDPRAAERIRRCLEDRTTAQV